MVRFRAWSSGFGNRFLRHSNPQAPCKVTLIQPMIHVPFPSPTCEPKPQYGALIIRIGFLGILQYTVEKPYRGLND